MVSKDQTIGGAIFAVCVIIGVSYTVGLFYLGGDPFKWELSFTLIAIPVFIAFIAIMGIGAWIGWTMATTPPPKPIEEITGEVEEKKEEKAEVEEKPQAPTEEATTEITETEEEKKKPERKKK
ncbi:MAG: transcriptional regulator [Candidatus Bathyarchaeia archaeon]